MRVILIDPVAKAVKDLVIPAENFNTEVYAALSFDHAGGRHVVDTYEPLQIGDHEAVLVDENARLFRDKVPFATWFWGVSKVSIYGRGLVVGMGEEEFTGTALAAAYVAGIVRWGG